ncbi:protein of unknown function (DUF1996) domain containing protein [Elaphomyces granulatus]
MLSNSVGAFVLLIACSVTPVSAFWRMPCPGRLVTERADPIVDPGQVSGHVHSIAGGSGFTFTMDYAQARSSKCSSCPIKQDLSNYWTPALYYHAQNGSFISVPQAGDSASGLGGMTVYYLQRAGPNNDKLTAFPEGFRMLAGNPWQRNFTGDFAGQAISFNCLDYTGPAVPETNGFPSKNCPNGLRAQVFFPSCWDGKNLDSPDHKSHVAYPASGAYNDGPCPSTHPVHLISLFYEVIWQTNLYASDWYGSNQPFAFANGDPTGYGLHGDFINGWDVNVLQTAVDDCLNLSGNIADCKTPDGNQVFDLFTDQECSNCRLPSPVNEQVYGVLPKLPGCNPLTSGPERAVPASCPVTPIGSASGYFADLTTTKHWQYLGCGTDMVNNRTFQGQSTANDQMTVEKCVDFCSSNGYKYAGTEYSTQCYCDNSLPSDRAPIPGIMGNCLMTCAGNSNEFCGSAAALSIYQNCAGLSTCQNAVIGSSGTTPGTPSSGVYTSSNIPSRSTPASSYTPMNSPAQTSIIANAKYTLATSVPTTNSNTNTPLLNTPPTTYTPSSPYKFGTGISTPAQTPNPSPSAHHHHHHHHSKPSPTGNYPYHFSRRFLWR